MNWPETERFLLALVIWREARGEGSEGMLAVAWVIENRHRKGWGDRSRAITAPNQFSSISVLSDPQTVKWPRSPDPAWERAMGLANAFTGLPGATPPEPDPTEGALYYWNSATATSGWFRQAIESGKLVQTVQLGHHSFYREA